MINDQVRQLPVTDNKSNAWANKVASAVNANNIVAGTGIRVDYAPQGTNVSLDTFDDNIYMQYAGDFDPAAEYYPNQVVRVLSSSTYIMPYGAPNSGSVIPFSPSGSITPIVVGTFICVNYIPPATANEAYLISYIAPLYSLGLPFQLIQGTRFYEANIYYPIVEFPATGSYTIFDGHSTIVSSQSFWKQLGGGSSSPTTSSGLIQFTCQNDFSDYMICTSDTAGTQSVAKPPETRWSVSSAVVDGLSISYTNYATNYRLATGNSTSEKEALIPRLNTGSSVIFAQQADHTNAFSNSVELTWQDINVAGRAWARKYNQS